MPATGVVARERPPLAGWRYSVVRKAAMAISGLALVVFLFGHWAGNLVLLEGEAAFDAYMVWMGEHHLLHYGVWFVLIVSFGAHLAVGPAHWLLNRRARPVRYRKQRCQVTTRAARTMMLSGTLVLLFVAVHVMQVRGWPPFDGGSIYRNMQLGFAHWAVVSIYLAGQVALAFHLYHGLWSQFQTLGLSHPSWDHWRGPLAALVAVGIALLNVGLVLLNVPAVRDLQGVGG
jgi:succinate dehydrogenase / fumarate reductase cytochrome b subunit